MDEIAPGDFVQMGTSSSLEVGLVYNVESGEAYVWWYTPENPETLPRVVSKRHPVSDLKLIEPTTAVPGHLLALRSENFPD